MKNKKLIWPFSFYFLRFAGAATYRPYLVFYYQPLSFTGAQIGLLVGIAPLITLFGLPLVTGFADRTNRHKLVMGYSIFFSIYSNPFLKIFQKPLTWS
jgi:MFS family permease